MKKEIFLLLSLLFAASTLLAQEFKVSGVVSSSDDKQPLIGVSVMVKGSTRGVATDINGKYSINVSANDKLSFQYVGYTTEVVAVKQTQTTLNVVLSPSSKVLDEVVAIGYGYQKKSLVTGAISSVASKEFERVGIMRADEVLQGKTAGVTVMANSGQPGDAPIIRIRGIGTNGNSTPLYIVDGISLNNIEFLNPRDIQSMEVLKDAASCAIYGARGANGVILIQTKSGKVGERATIKYDYSYGVQNMRKKLDLLDARSYAIIQNEAAFNGGQTLPFSAADMAKLGKGTDWQEEILNKNAPIVSHQLTLNGGSEKNTYNMSVSKFTQEGIFAKGKSKFDRWTLRENTDHLFLNDKLKVGQSFILSLVEKQTIDPNNIFGGPILGALNMDPVTPVRNEDGTFGESKYLSQEITNPVAKLAVTFGNYKYTQILTNAFAEFSLLRNLKLKSTVALEMFIDEGSSFRPVYRLNSATINTVTGVTKSTQTTRNQSYENYITYTPTFGKHNLSFLVGNSILKSDWSNLGGSKQGLLIPDEEHAYLDLAKNETSAQTWGGKDQGASVSYFGRFNYTYSDLYMFTSSFRSDG